MGRKRRPPPLWWLLGYVAQYQPQALLEHCTAIGIDPAALYAASKAAALSLPSPHYRRLSKAWAVQQSRQRRGV